MRDYLTPQGAIRVGEQRQSDNHSVFLPTLGWVVLNFIRDEEEKGILLTKARADGTIKQWRLYETGNASVLVFQPNADTNPIWSGRIQIHNLSNHGEHHHNSNPFLTYQEFQRMVAQTTPKVF